MTQMAPKNCTNDYPVAMAEKRAKDRVILKLAGLSGHVYSEEEADEFKESAPKRSGKRESWVPVDPVANESPAPAPVRRVEQGVEPPYRSPVAPAVPPAAPMAPPVVQEVPVSTGVDPVDAIRDYLVQCGGEAPRGSILEATGLTIGVFNGAISRLRESGDVGLFGRRRAAKWKMLSGMTVGEGDAGPQVEVAPPLEAVPDPVQPLANVTREFTGFPSVRQAHANSVMTVEAMDKIRAALAR